MEKQREEDFQKKREEFERKEKELDRQYNSRNRSSSRAKKSYLDKGIDSILGTVTRSIGREIARGILGSIKKR